MNEDNNTQVLVVENSIEFSNWIESELQKIESINGILIAKTISMGQSLILEHKPGIVVLDLVLSDGSGLKLLKKIRELDIATIVIVFTSYNIYRKECRKHGCDYFFDKTDEFEELIDTITLVSNKISRKKIGINE